MLAHSPFRSPLYWCAFAAGLAWTLLLWTRAGPDASVLDDEIGHFLVARDSWAHPQLILNAWGRAGTTLSFMLPAAVGLEAARAAALAISAATVLVTTAVARLLGVRALALVPVFLWFQPWFHLYGNAVLTEVPFSLAMIAGCWAALAGRAAVASLLFGLLPLMRHEGIAVLGLWALFLVVRGQWRLAALGAVPLVAYQAAFAVVFGEAPFALYFRTTASAPYGHGEWLHYALPLVRSIGPPVALLAALGLWLGRRNLGLLLFAAPFVLLVLLETVIFRLGLFGSGGNAEFLLPAATLAAVAAGLAADRVMEMARGRRSGALRRSMVMPALAAVVLAAATAAYALRTQPADADGAAQPMRAAVRFLETRRVDLNRVTATHVWFFAMSGARIPADDGLRSPWSHPPRPARLAPGSIAVWDCFYSNRFGLRWRRLAAAGFVELGRFGGGRVVVLQRTGRQRALGPQPRCNS